MKNLNLKNSLFLIVGISIGFFFLFAFLKNITEFSLINVLKIIPKVVSADVVFIGFFSLHLWKWKIFKGWLVPFPNLNGTWKGFIHTTWVDPKTNERPAQIPAIVTIHQSFTKISCVMRTAEMNSRSIISDIVLDKDNQLKRLFYSYDSNPTQTVKERSPQHYGTMAFDIIEEPERKLIGEYWTDRKTTGQVEVIFWKKKKLDYYPDEIREHPVSKIRENKR